MYLELPLTLKRPNRALYMPLIEKIEAKLEGWKSRLISRGGRLQLMNSVLNSIPIYFMASFLLPQWVINRIDKIRRDFLWGKTSTGYGISLIKWAIMCLPRENGGMGGANLTIQNWSLLLRWWWTLYRNPNSLWTQTILEIRCINGGTHMPRIWILQGSLFWNQLLKIKPLFLWSTHWSIGSGAAISYLFDSWTSPIMASTSTSTVIRPTRLWSLQKAVENGMLHNISLSTSTQDQIHWRWLNNYWSQHQIKAQAHN